MLKQLRIKFVCITMAIITVMLCVILGLLIHFTAHNMEQESIQMLRSVAEFPQKMRPMNDRPYDTNLPYFTVQVMGDRILVNGGLSQQTDEEFLNGVLAASLPGEERTGVLKEYHLRYYKASTPNGACIAYGDITNEQSTLRSLLRTSLLVGAAGLLVFLAISIWLARWAVRPVEKAWKQQRQFIADASHELKTPLTVITTNAELLQSPQYTEADRSRFSGSILTMTRQMRGLVEGMLELARVDNGTAVLEFERLDLSQLAADALLPFEPVFFEQELTLSADLTPAVFVRGSAARLSQVVEILLDNAQKYSAPGGQAKVTLNRTGHNRCLLQVANTGEAISEEDQKRIFERFYRADKARSMNQSYGLGLSIAQSIVQEHAGHIWCESRDGWNRFCVELPALN